jgi:hypothetical protein
VAQIGPPTPPPPPPKDRAPDPPVGRPGSLAALVAGLVVFALGVLLLLLLR